jgi:hypothetical protein
MDGTTTTSLLLCPTGKTLIIMDNANNKRMRETELTPEDFILWGKEIQNKSGRTGSCRRSGETCPSGIGSRLKERQNTFFGPSIS